MRPRYLDGIVRCLLTIKAAHGRLDDTGILFDLENGIGRVFVDDVFLDRVLQLGVGALVQVVIIDSCHGHDHHAGSTVFRHVAVIDPLRKEWRVVVDVLQVDLWGEGKGDHFISDMHQVIQCCPLSSPARQRIQRGHCLHRLGRKQ